jgi:hypothetical protein
MPVSADGALIRIGAATDPGATLLLTVTADPECA